MASFSADLYVSGQRFPVVQCTYGTDQATDNRGRVVAKVRYGPVQLVLDVPDSDMLLSWANMPQKQLATDIVFRQAAGGGTQETLHMAGAYCVGYQETFASGDQDKGAYQCHLTLVDPAGFTLSAGSPVQALINVPGGLVSVATAAEETGLAQAVAEPVAETVVETTAPTVLGGLARLALLLPELMAATIVAVFVPTNSRDDPGYKPEWDIIRRNAVVTDKDRAELAYLEQRHQDGTLTAAEEQQLLPLLARVRGLHMPSLAGKVPAGFPDAETFARAGEELKAALKESGLEYKAIGVRGSSVTGLSSKGGSFRLTAQNGLKASDVDTFIDLSKEVDLTSSKSIPGFIHPDKLLKRYPALKEWSRKWSRELGREITPGAFMPGTFTDKDILPFP
ncbi:MAG: hypothetical protein EOO55_03110 [Hymenobacter sp.]|nr:MAG: hypothetical protein EOO55_03110 [Hymenobacter sp.]